MKIVKTPPLGALLEYVRRDLVFKFVTHDGFNHTEADAELESMSAIKLLELLADAEYKYFSEQPDDTSLAKAEGK